MAAGFSKKRRWSFVVGLCLPALRSTGWHFLLLFDRFGTTTSGALALLCVLCGFSLRSWRLNAFFVRSLRSPKTKRQGRPPAVIFEIKKPYLPRLTAFFSSAPGVNFATRRAAILIVAPV